jgi:hypothetical protein
MNRDNVVLLQKARSMCLLYGIACLVAGLISFSLWDERALGSLLLLVAIFGFWRLSHKMRSILKTEEPKFFQDSSHEKDAHGRRA